MAFQLRVGVWCASIIQNMRILFLAAFAATFLAALNYQATPPKLPPYKPDNRPRAANPTRTTEPTPSSATSKRSANLIQNDQNILTPAEKNQYIKWMQSRGFDIKANETSPQNPPSIYIELDTKSLSELAEKGDARAAQALAEQILSSGQHGKYGLPARALQDEAIQLLIKATILGYTSSADRLMEVYRQRAMYIGEQTRINKAPFDREALAEAYMYAFFLEKRGDLNEETNIAMLKSTGQLYPNEIEQARFKAEQLYYQMTNQRSLLGLPAFDDGVPDEIIKISQKITP